jgi:hypothetical protein
LEGAIDAFQALDDRRGAARAMLAVGIVLSRLADPRWQDLPMDALALLEPLPPGPVHVAALTEVAVSEVLLGRSEAGIEHAGRALVLADELALPRPARALGLRGLQRCSLGDRGGLDDQREAIVLATEAGQGREVALQHNWLAMSLLSVEGPSAALAVLQRGIAFARARGLTEIAGLLTNNVVDLLFETGEPGRALDLAAELATDNEANGNLHNLLGVRVTQAWILTLRGQASEIAGTLDWLEATSREIGMVESRVGGLGIAAYARAALAQPDRAAVLLAEIDGIPGSHDDYVSLLPTLVRTALAIDNPQLADRLTTGVEPHTPQAEHALTSVNAALAEANGHHQAAAAGYADAARRWEAFGVIPEQAFAHLGHGRCLLALGRTTDATPVLRQARELFARLKAAPYVAECDTLLAQAAEQAS